MTRFTRLFGILFGAFLLIAAFTVTVFAYTSPGKPTGIVNDFAGVLSGAQKAELENKLGNFARPAGVQVAVVTVPSLGGDSIENYAVTLFEEWGIGEKIKDNGLLLLIAPADRQARIEVGYGLEPTITDAMASVIVNKVMIPSFKTGDYFTGINNGTDKIIGLVEADPQTKRFVTAGIAEAGATSSPLSDFSQIPAPVANVLVVIVISIIVLLLFTRAGRTVLFYIIITGIHSGRSGAGSGGSGRSGGGFGGFGGGRSGGGGASGRW